MNFFLARKERYTKFSFQRLKVYFLSELGPEPESAKKTRSRSKTDRLRNTSCNIVHNTTFQDNISLHGERGGG